MGQYGELMKWARDTSRSFIGADFRGSQEEGRPSQNYMAGRQGGRAAREQERGRRGPRAEGAQKSAQVGPTYTVQQESTPAKGRHREQRKGATPHTETDNFGRR